MPTTRVMYSVDDATIADFEIEPGDGFTPAAAHGEIIASVHDAVGPALQAARAVLDRMKPQASETVTVRFGVRVSGDQR
jgi:hypothetical protein